jgi:single-strand DNA-binding protein
MANAAHLTLVGNIGRDPETRYTPNGQMNLTFTMAVNTKRGQEEVTNWFRVTAWGRLAETLDGLSQQGALAKGREVFVAGTFVAREYQSQQGETRTSLDVRADAVQLIGGRESSSSQQAGISSGGSYGAGSSLDDVPF